MSETLSQFPVDYLSYSAIKTFCADRYAFKKRYILGLYDEKTRPSGLAGKAFHRAMEEYVVTKGDIQTAKEAGLQYIEFTNDEEVNWGQTGSREKVIKKFSDGFENFIAEVPIDFDSVIGVEEKFEELVTYHDTTFPIPFKCFVDRIDKVNGQYRAIDYKLKDRLSNPGAEQGAYTLQAMMIFFCMTQRYGEAPESITFYEVKPTKNKDGSSQIQEYTIDYSQTDHYKILFCHYLDAIVHELKREDIKFLPNFSDFFTGQESWHDFADETFDFEMPKAIPVKVTHREFKEARFVPQISEKLGNEDLEPAEKIRVKLMEFGIACEMAEVFHGPSVDLYALQPSRGVAMSAFAKHSGDLQLALGAETVRVDAPIPGTKFVGIEVSKDDRKFVNFDSKAHTTPNSLELPIGIDVFGNLIKKDLRDMPHFLIAGATGSGKSVAINCFLEALTLQNSPDELALILIDPKMVELARFESVPHLKGPSPLTDIEGIITKLEWSVFEMQRRYTELKKKGYRSIEEHNKKES